MVLVYRVTSTKFLAFIILHNETFTSWIKTKELKKTLTIAKSITINHCYPQLQVNFYLIPLLVDKFPYASMKKKNCCHSHLSGV